MTVGKVDYIDIGIPDPDEPDEPRWFDHMRASWVPKAHPDQLGDYWLVCGDNTGSQQLVIYPYMYHGLRALLDQMEKAHADD
jgi:hypothetical protein